MLRIVLPCVCVPALYVDSITALYVLLVDVNVSVEVLVEVVVDVDVDVIMAPATSPSPTAASPRGSHRHPDTK